MDYRSFLTQIVPLLYTVSSINCMLPILIKKTEIPHFQMRLVLAMMMHDDVCEPNPSSQIWPSMKNERLIYNLTEIHIVGL